MATPKQKRNQRKKRHPRATAEYKQVYVRQCAACGGDHRMGACDSFPATWRVVQK
jgi:ribosomal protein L32